MRPRSTVYCVAATMAHFQLPANQRKLLRGAPARFFVHGDSGPEELGLQVSRTVQLELVSSTRDPKSLEIKSDDEKIAKIVKIDGSGSTRIVTVQTQSAGKANLIGRDKSGSDREEFPLLLRVGKFENHGGMATDFIAEVCNGSELAKIHALRRLLNNNPDNLFDEQSDANVKAHGVLACGTVCKVGGQKIFHSGTEYDYREYYRPIQKKKTEVLQWSHLKYDVKKVVAGRQAIQRALASKRPVIVGCLYNPASANAFLDKYNTISVTKGGGHTVLVVGASGDGRNLLYIDVYPDSSHLKYTGGIDNEFKHTGMYLGEFVVDENPAGPKIGKSAVTKGGWPLVLVAGPLR